MRGGSVKWIEDLSDGHLFRFPLSLTSWTLSGPPCRDSTMKLYLAEVQKKTIMYIYALTIPDGTPKKFCRHVCK